MLAADVLDHADDGAVAIGGGALAHVERAVRAAHAVLHLAAAVAAHVVGQPHELDAVGGLDGDREVARLDALAAQAAGLDELAREAGLGQARAVGSERGERRCQRGQRARAGRSRAGVIDEWAHHMEHRRGCSSA